jgi:fructose-1,6-bisphosphatase I
MATTLQPVDLASFVELAAERGLDHAVGTIVCTIASTAAELAEVLADRPVGTWDGSARNASGDVQHPIDLLAHDLFVRQLSNAPVRAVLSEEAHDPIPLDPGARHAVAIDPIDGSSNLATNGPTGTIFSVLACAAGETDRRAFLQTGEAMRAAGFVMYGPATVMALSVGHGTHLFTLDRHAGRFVCSAMNAVVPEAAREFAINAANRRHWDQRVRDYIDDLVAGEDGPRDGDFNMRWIAAVVADTYRILVRGGIFLYPGDAREGYRSGRLRLIYEAFPLAYLVEQAGGAATDLRGRVLDRRPCDLHERTPLAFGSPDKVRRLEEYLTTDGHTGERSPLFADRGLFRS